MARGKKGINSNNSNNKAKSNGGRTKKNNSTSDIIKQKKRKGVRRKQSNTFEVDADDLETVLQQIEHLSLQLYTIQGDGNCLFRAISFQLFGSQDQHTLLREQAMDHIENNESDFAPFVEDDEPFDKYVERMREDAEWGGNLELLALARLYSVCWVIHQAEKPRFILRADPPPPSSSEPISITASGNETNGNNRGARKQKNSKKGNNTKQEPVTIREMHLSYHDGDHYNAVRRLDDDGDGPVDGIRTEAANPTREQEEAQPQQQQSNDKDMRILKTVSDIANRLGVPVKEVERVFSQLDSDALACEEHLRLLYPNGRRKTRSTAAHVDSLNVSTGMHTGGSVDASTDISNGDSLDISTGTLDGGSLNVSTGAGDGHSADVVTPSTLGSIGDDVKKGENEMTAAIARAQRRSARLMKAKKKQEKEHKRAMKRLEKQIGVTLNSTSGDESNMDTTSGTSNGSVKNIAKQSAMDLGALNI